MDRLRIATRRSPLALAQARWVAENVRAHAPAIEIEEVHVVTQGDRITDVPLAKVGGKGLFVAEIEVALADGRADVAVHSMKDVPDALAPGMELVCVPEREDPGDVLVAPGGAGLFDLPAGARVGTSSLRRAVQLAAARGDLSFRILRGNVGTRLRKLDEGIYDAIVLAAAGLRRLGLAAGRPLAPIGPDVMIPAVGQGALGIEARAGDARVGALLAPLEHAPTRICVEAERAFLAALGGSCTTPLAAHAHLAEGSLCIDGMVGAIDGSRILRASVHTWIGANIPSAEAIVAARAVGRDLAARLLAEGADDLVRAARAARDPYAALFGVA